MKLNKQQEILQFIQNKLENEGYSPSIREIAEEVNLKSTSSVQYHLNNLIEKYDPLTKTFPPTSNIHTIAF